MKACEFERASSGIERDCTHLRGVLRWGFSRVLRRRFGRILRVTPLVRTQANFSGHKLLDTSFTHAERGSGHTRSARVSAPRPLD